MEIKTLQYFLAIAREETISRAAEYLHITQPSLSRKMKDLEEEFNTTLFTRGNRKITLTEDGILLRKRAEEIVSLVEKTEMDMMSSNSVLTGDIYIGWGESYSTKIITRSIEKMKKKHPQVRFHFHSGNAIDITDKIDKGLIDFGLLAEYPKISDYNYITLPILHHWGVLMRKDSPLATLESITLQDIINEPIIVSEEVEKNKLFEWLGGDLAKLNIVSTYNLLYNSSLMVEDNLGYAICFDKIINTSSESLLTFRPLEPALDVSYSLIWKKYQVFSKASKYFLSLVQETINEFIESEYPI